MFSPYTSDLCFCDLQEHATWESLPVVKIIRKLLDCFLHEEAWGIVIAQVLSEALHKNHKVVSVNALLLI